jgi:hypothetical protein
LGGEDWRIERYIDGLESEPKIRDELLKTYMEMNPIFSKNRSKYLILSILLARKSPDYIKYRDMFSRFGKPATHEILFNDLKHMITKKVSLPDQLYIFQDLESNLDETLRKSKIKEHIKYEIAELTNHIGAVDEIFRDNLSSIKDVSKFIILQSKWMEYCKDKGTINLTLKLLALWYYLNPKDVNITITKEIITLDTDGLCKIIGEKIQNMLYTKK